MESENEVDVISLFWIVWDQKYLVLAISLLGGVLAAIFALRAVPIYRAQIIVTEAHDAGMGASGSMMGQLGGLASIAGLNLNTNGPDAEYAAVLASRALVETFVTRYNLAPLINGTHKFQNPVWFATERFRKSELGMHEDKVKDITTITIDWTDPAIAARWANDFVGLANELLRTRAIQEATRNIEYLNKQLAHTDVVEIQRAIYGLIESETKTLMLANGRTEYAFRVVDPAVAPQVRYSPQRTLIVISGLFLGGFIGSIIAWVRQVVRRPRPIATS